MEFKLKINKSEAKEEGKVGYIGWTPVKCSLSIVGYTGKVPAPVEVSAEIISGGTGKIALYLNNKKSAKKLKKLSFTFSKKDEEMHFYIAGDFPHASKEKKDTTLKILSTAIGVKTLRIPIMVRVRKNANTLTEPEIKNFLKAFVRLNNKKAIDKYDNPTPPYTKKPSKLFDELVLMHTYDAAYEIHSRTSFHPWHRMFLLHLERELQEVDPRVTLPFWKFDKKAERVFTKDFIGETKYRHTDDGPDIKGILIPTFNLDNPLFSYKNATIWGPLTRSYRNDNPAAKKARKEIKDEENILSLRKYKSRDESEMKTDIFDSWSCFEERESHNKAHGTFNGRVVDIGKDPVDPLFFLLHTNVDRLWAKWQKKYNRFDQNDEATYPYQGKAPNREECKNPPKSKQLGNYVKDGLWPWTPDYKAPRPTRKWEESHAGSEISNTVPNIKLGIPTSPTSTFIKEYPLLGDAIDYHGELNPGYYLGFDYIDVPYFDEDSVMIFEEDKQDIVVNIEEAHDIFFSNTYTLEERLVAVNKNGFTLENHQQALEFLKDEKQEDQLREKLLYKVTQEDEAFLETSIHIINNEKESSTLRSEAIHVVRISKRSSASFMAIKPKFHNALRKLIHVTDKPLQSQAIEILSSYEDIHLQEELEKIVKSKKDSFISLQDAIFFLSMYSKQDPTPFKEVLEVTKDISIKVGAIEALANDSGAKDILLQIMRDEKENSKVREASALSLHSIDFELMNLQALDIIKEQKGVPLLNADTEQDIEGLQFNTVLMNLLLYTGDISVLSKKNDFIQTLRGIEEVVIEKVESDTMVVSSGESELSKEKKRFEGMAIELLARINKNEEL